MSDIPAGWQPDPRGRHEYRYWDGAQWTDHVSNQGEVSSDPVADTTPAATGDDKSQIFGAEGTTAPAADEPTAVQPAATPEPVADESAPGPAAATPEPEPVAATPEPEREPFVAEPVIEPMPAVAGARPASSAPPGGTTEPATAHTDAKAAARDVLHSRSPELATVLTAAIPGSGHFYMGTDKVPLAAGLLLATLVAVVISHLGFLFFLIGFAIWLGAVVFGLTDLRGSAAAAMDVKLPANVVGIVLIAAGALLIISLLLPYYRVSFEAEAAGFGTGSASGSLNAFDAFKFEDFILLAVGVVSILGGAASMGLGPLSASDLPKQLPTVIAVGGAVAVVLIVFRMLIDSIGGTDAPGVDVSVGRAFGIWIGLWSAITLTLANLGMLRSLTNK